MRSITITQALTELKLYDSKIRKSLSDSEFVGAEKTKLNKIGHITKDEFADKAKSDYQSVCDLITNRAVIKSKIAESNAKTYVTVNDIKMSVAEAIERKNSVVYEQLFLNEMKNQFSKATQLMNKKNTEVDLQITKMLEIMVGKDASSSTLADREATEKIYRENNEFSLVDPIDIVNKIETLQEKIDGFLSNVDVTLSVSNAVTFIEVN